MKPYIAGHVLDYTRIMLEHLSGGASMKRRRKGGGKKEGREKKEGGGKNGGRGKKEGGKKEEGKRREKKRGEKRGREKKRCFTGNLNPIPLAVNQLYHACKGCISFYQLSPSGYALGLELIKLMQPLHAWYNYYLSPQACEAHTIMLTHINC